MRTTKAANSLVVLFLLVVPAVFCGSTSSPPSLQSADADDAEQKTVLRLPSNFGRFTGDRDDMVKRHQFRALVIYNHGGFYYDRGPPRGMVVDALTEFETVINRKLKSRVKKFIVDYISVPPTQLQQSLNDGVGDIICSGIIVTSERESSWTSLAHRDRHPAARRHQPERTSLEQRRRSQRRRHLCQLSRCSTSASRNQAGPGSPFTVSIPV